MLLMDKSQLMYRLIPEDQDPDVRMTVASDDSNLLAEFIQRMTMPVSFRLPLAESFAVEGDSYAFIFDIGYVPVSIKQVITERCLNEAEVRSPWCLTLRMLTCLRKDSVLCLGDTRRT
jgi:hypothetical protein